MSRSPSDPVPQLGERLRALLAEAPLDVDSTEGDAVQQAIALDDHDAADAAINHCLEHFADGHVRPHRQRLLGPQRLDALAQQRPLNVRRRRPQAQIAERELTLLADVSAFDVLSVAIGAKDHGGGPSAPGSARGSRTCQLRLLHRHPPAEPGAKSPSRCRRN